MENLILGATILGTGGGGDPKEGLSMLLEDLQKGRKLKVASLTEIDDDALIVCPYFCGSIAPIKKKPKTIVFKDPMIEAFTRMEKRLGAEISATVAVELGGSNTAIPIHVASVMDIPIVDGDYVGRAAPELLQSTANIFDVSLLPSIMVTEPGDVITVERFADLDEYEYIARSLSLPSGSVAVVDTPINGNVAKKVLIKESISKCMKVGKTVRQANEAGKDPIPKLVKSLTGVLLFKGIVKEYTWEDREGFLYGEAVYEGINEWKGHELKIWIKNENIIAWKDGKVVVTAPDPIYVVDEEGHAITNAQLKEGMTAVAIGAKAPEVWLTQKGIELFGPKHFGFEFDYVPIKGV
ncbi:MAG: DUF917 domain-containing protein [Candidatus Bathycorpusculaceae bacterium]